MNRLAIAMVLAALLPVGCAPAETRVVRVVDTSGFPSSPWIGKPESLVLETWGPNPDRDPGDGGGAILAYRKDSWVTVTTPRGGIVAPATGSEAPPSPFGTESRPATQDVVARFWIDAEGRVTRVWFAHSVVKAGKDVPPAPSN